MLQVARSTVPHICHDVMQTWYMDKREFQENESDPKYIS